MSLMKTLVERYPALENDEEWLALCKLVPVYVRLTLGTVYNFYGKTPMRAVVTKENGKSWIAYEINGSVKPGTRWTLGKTWCTPSKVKRACDQEYQLPGYVVLK